MKPMLFPLLLWALQLADWGLTRWAIEAGRGHETSAGAAAIMAQPNGFLMMLGLKLLWTFLMVFFVWCLELIWLKFARAVQTLFVALCASPLIFLAIQFIR